MRIAIAIVLTALASPALAQQSQDPQVLVYRQLLDAANAQLVSAVANAGTRIEALTKQVTDLKAKCGKPCEDEPKKPGAGK
jgi:hypothetical protein